MIVVQSGDNTYIYTHISLPLLTNQPPHSSDMHTLSNNLLLTKRE
jgi:hypothetical protein